VFSARQPKQMDEDKMYQEIMQVERKEAHFKLSISSSWLCSIFGCIQNMDVARNN